MIERIEDLFEPLNQPEPPAPNAVDEAVDVYGYDEVMATLNRIVDVAETGGEGGNR
jgi:hypothetical protein